MGRVFGLELELGLELGWVEGAVEVEGGSEGKGGSEGGSESQGDQTITNAHLISTTLPRYLVDVELWQRVCRQPWRRHRRITRLNDFTITKGDGGIHRQGRVKDDVR